MSLLGAAHIWGKDNIVYNIKDVVFALEKNSTFETSLSTITKITSSKTSLKDGILIGTESFGKFFITKDHVVNHKPAKHVALGEMVKAQIDLKIYNKKIKDEVWDILDECLYFNRKEEWKSYYENNKKLIAHFPALLYCSESELERFINKVQFSHKFRKKDILFFRGKLSVELARYIQLMFWKAGRSCKFFYVKTNVMLVLEEQPNTFINASTNTIETMINEIRYYPGKNVLCYDIEFKDVPLLPTVMGTISF